MEDVSAKLDKAANAVKNNEKKMKDAKQEDVLDIYGCYKLATVGKCNIDRWVLE